MKPFKNYMKAMVVFLAVLFSTVLSLPLYAAEVKTLDDLDKTIFSDAIKSRCLRYQQASAVLQKALDGLNTGDEISSLHQINKALAQLVQSEKLLAKANEELSELTNYITVNQIKLTSGGLDALVPLAKLNDSAYRSYNESVKAYFVAFNAMLEYSKTNMPALRAGRTAEMDGYELRYRAYVDAANRHGEAYAAWSQFLLDFGQAYPGLRPYLENKSEEEEML